MNGPVQNDFDGLVQDCSISNALEMEILQAIGFIFYV